MLNKDKLAVSSADLKRDEGYKDTPGFVLRRVVDPESGGSIHFRMSLVTLNPKVGSSRHAHYNCDEGWYIVAGKGIFYADGRKVIFKRGDFLFIHKSVVHQLINTGKSVLTYIAITAPPCDFKNDVHLVEKFDPQRHITLTPENPTKMKGIEFPSPMWIERLRQAVNSDSDFFRAAEWFDGSIVLGIGKKEYWMKIFMGQIIRVIEGRRPFGTTFAIRGPETAWRKLFISRNNIFRKMISMGELVMDGNIFESKPIKKAIKLLLDKGRSLGM